MLLLLHLLPTLSLPHDASHVDALILALPKTLKPSRYRRSSKSAAFSKFRNSVHIIVGTMQVEQEKSRVEPLINENENGFASWQSAMQRTENEGKRTLHVGTGGNFFKRLNSLLLTWCVRYFIFMRLPLFRDGQQFVGYY